jgi:hypothetical protein
VTKAKDIINIKLRYEWYCFRSGVDKIPVAVGCDPATMGTWLPKFRVLNAVTKVKK